MINLLGKGFIGSHFCQLYPCIVNEKYDFTPKTENVSDILYMISTVDNYNVKTSPYLDINTNLITLINVLENIKNNKNIVFNFVSSWFVYGRVSSPVSEESICDPKGFYSITKRTAEQLLISYCETYGIKYRILRLGNVLGLGDTKISKKKNATTWIIKEMKNNNPVEIYDNGSTIRDYIHVKDACKAIKLIIDTGETNTIYNIGNGIPISLNEIINHVKTLGSTSQIISIPTSDFHKIVQVDKMYMNIDKIQNLGYKQDFDIYKTVEELYNSY